MNWLISLLVNWVIGQLGNWYMVKKTRQQRSSDG